MIRHLLICNMEQKLRMDLLTYPISFNSLTALVLQYILFIVFLWHIALFVFLPYHKFKLTWVCVHVVNCTSLLLNKKMYIH
jgi:hypothetical protein